MQLTGKYRYMGPIEWWSLSKHMEVWMSMVEIHT